MEKGEGEIDLGCDLLGCDLLGSDLLGVIPSG